MGALHALQLAVLAWLATATTAGMWPKELTEAQAQAFGSTWDLLFTATPVSFLGSSSSRQAFYYNNVTLAAQGPVYMIQAAWNTSLCLSLSSSSPMETDIPMVFQPCALLDSWGTPPLEALQSFKLIKRCGVNEWVLQQWTGREVESTDITGFVTTHPLEGTWMCVAWDAASGTVTQQVCTNSNSTAQRWVMSQTLEATQSLCPPVSASTFLASSPADVLQSMHNFLGCPPSVISAWATASPIVTRGQASTLPSCFNIQLLQVMFYDGVITQGMLSFGKRDPEYLPASPMGASTLVDLMLGPSAVWGSNGQWPLGTPLMAWFRAVDVVMLTNSTMLQSAPVLVPATTTTPSSLAAPPLIVPLYPWSLLSSVDSLVVTCTPAAAHGLGGPLPGTLLSVFAMGLRSLSMRQCGVSGTLPEAWATAGGVAARQYVHIYPVLMDFSSNKLTGDIPSIWMDGWLDCFVSQMDLSHNQMNVTLTDRQLQSTCAGGSGGAYSMCSYFKTSLESDVPAFRQHVNYFKGPVDETECGVVTQGLGFSGKSWNHNALARAFVYAWEFDFITNNPCQAGVTCDLDVSSYTFQVKRADAAPVPYSLILDGNPIIGIPDSWTADGKAWFAWAPCDKRITFADLVHNSCVAFSPSPYLEITWSLIAAALVICSFIGGHSP